MMTENVNYSSLVDKAYLLVEYRGYKDVEMKEKDGLIDFIALSPDSEEKVLIRVAINALKSGLIGVDIVKAMKETLKEEDFGKGILIGFGFTSAARKRMKEAGIEAISGNEMLPYNTQKLYTDTLRFVDDLCEVKCGIIPKTKSECKGFSEGPIKCLHCDGKGKIENRWSNCPYCNGEGFIDAHYPCRIRLISDNAYFHFEHNWIRLLQNDLLSLLTIKKSLKNEPSGIENEKKNRDI